MEQAKPEPVFPVGFDEDALAEDLERAPPNAETPDLRGFPMRLNGVEPSRPVGHKPFNSAVEGI